MIELADDSLLLEFILRRMGVDCRIIVDYDLSEFDAIVEVYDDEGNVVAQVGVCRGSAYEDAVRRLNELIAACRVGSVESDYCPPSRWVLVEARQLS